MTCLGLSGGRVVGEFSFLLPEPGDELFRPCTLLAVTELLAVLFRIELPVYFEELFPGNLECEGCCVLICFRDHQLFRLDAYCLELMSVSGSASHQSFPRIGILIPGHPIFCHAKRPPTESLRTH